MFYSSLLEKPVCFLKDGYEFIIAPFKLVSLGGINLVFGLVWYPIGLMIAILAAACSYFCLFVIIPSLPRS